MNSFSAEIEMAATSAACSRTWLSLSEVRYWCNGRTALRKTGPAASLSMTEVVVLCTNGRRAARLVLAVMILSVTTTLSALATAGSLRMSSA